MASGANEYRTFRGVGDYNSMTVTHWPLKDELQLRDVGPADQFGMTYNRRESCVGRSSPHHSMFGLDGLLFMNLLVYYLRNDDSTTKPCDGHCR